MCDFRSFCENFVNNYWGQLEHAFTKQQLRDTYQNFTFRNSAYSSKYRLRLRKIVDGENVENYVLDIYFETEGQNEEVRGRILRNLERLIKQNDWDFSLEEEPDCDSNIVKYFKPDDENNLGNPEWIKKTMLLIAKNLESIEAENLESIEG